MHRHHSPAGRMAVDGAAGIHFNTLGRGEGSGTSSPPLWSAKGASSPPPPSRLEAIERGQRELMEMVQSMPESGYELSLRDLVELPKPASAGDHPPEESAPPGPGGRWRRGGGKPEMKLGRGTATANGNGGDFMLRMFFPPTFGGSRSRSRKGRVSPEKYLDGECLKKRSSDHTNRNNRYHISSPINLDLFTFIYIYSLHIFI